MALRPDERHRRVMPDTVMPQKPDTTGGGLTMQPGFPGQLGLLAKQMNAGFGGGLLNQRNYLNSFYKPMQMQVQQNPGDDAKIADPSVTTGTGGTGGFELAPGMERWARLLYASPNAESQLAELQEGFKRMGLIK